MSGSTPEIDQKSSKIGRFWPLRGPKQAKTGQNGLKPAPQPGPENRQKKYRVSYRTIFEKCRFWAIFGPFSKGKRPKSTKIDPKSIFAKILQNP